MFFLFCSYFNFDYIFPVCTEVGTMVCWFCKFDRNQFNDGFCVSWTKLPSRLLISLYCILYLVVRNISLIFLQYINDFLKFKYLNC